MLKLLSCLLESYGDKLSMVNIENDKMSDRITSIYPLGHSECIETAVEFYLARVNFFHMFERNSKVL